MENVFQSKHPLVQHKLAKLRNKDTNPRSFASSSARLPCSWPMKLPPT